MRSGVRIILMFAIVAHMSACAAHIDRPYPVAHVDVAVETAHSGTIEVRASYPEGVADRFPVIVFSHGHYLTNDAYDALTKKWVEQGFVVLAPQHMDTGDRARVAKITEDVGSDWIAAARILDIKASLDQIDRLMASMIGFTGQVSTNRVIAAGHSLGALTAQLLGGATLEKQNDSRYPMPSMLRDDRVIAVVAISPPGEMPGYLTRKTWEGFDMPQLVITGTRDVFEYLWPDYRAHLVSYLTAEPGHNYLLVLDGMDHYMGGVIGRLDRPGPRQWDARDSAAEAALLFMHRYLDGREQSPASQHLTKAMGSPMAGVLRYEQR